MLHHAELFLGVELYTDHLPLKQAIDRYIAESATGTVYVEDEVPEIVFTAAMLRKELKSLGLTPKFMVYSGHVLQIWPEQGLPSSAMTLIPAGLPGALIPNSYTCQRGGLVDASDSKSDG